MTSGVCGFGLRLGRYAKRYRQHDGHDRNLRSGTDGFRRPLIGSLIIDPVAPRSLRYSSIYFINPRNFGCANTQLHHDPTLRHACFQGGGGGVIFPCPLYSLTRRRLGKPIGSLNGIMGDAVTVTVEDAQIVLSRTVTSHGRFIIPVRGQFPILPDS